jgi:hypothetical protein
LTDRLPYNDFDFDLARAVLAQLVEGFRSLPVGPLCPSILRLMKPGQGVYQLFNCETLVYTGKTDSDLPSRLLRHHAMLAARQNIVIQEMGFKALYIHRNWTTWTTETALIRFFGEESPWNLSGMGSNDPGHNREDTAEEETFNQRYPIDPHVACDWVKAGEYAAWDVLTSIKRDLPYLLRFHRVTKKFNRIVDRDAETELKNTNVQIPLNDMPISELVRTIAQQLSKGWQFTVFPGRMILYKETVNYQHGTIYWPTMDS